MALWRKKRLHIDLSNSKISFLDIPESILSKYIGGIGLGSYYLWKEVPPNIDPLGEENTLYFCIGPAQGTNITMTGRYCLVTKSPLTGLLMDSHAGGDIGPEMAFLGYDIISITGKAEKQSYIYIRDDDQVEILDWTFGKGKTTHQTDQTIQKHYNDSKILVMSTGPAGENLVPYACLVNEKHRNLGRGGAGALFGSKNLKAIAFRSTQRDVYRDEKINDIATIINSRVKKAREMQHPLHGKGTPWLLDRANSWGMLPTRNYQQGYYAKHENINDKMLEDKFHLSKKGCYRCGLNCTFVIKKEPFEWTTDSEVHMPEFETLGLMGSNLDVSDIDAITKMNHLCNSLGLDTISTGNSMGFIAELKEKNLIPTEIEHYLDEIPSFGETEKFINLVSKIAENNGLGNFVGLGPAEMASRSSENTSDFAIHVKKLPFAAWDPRGKLLLGLSYATAAIGASHLRGWSTALQPPSPFDINKEKHQEAFNETVKQMDLKILKDSLIICHFTHSIHPLLQIEDANQIISATTNLDLSIQDIRDTAHRIWLIQRMFNIREMKEDPINYDVLPNRFMNEPLSHAPAEGKRAFSSKKEFDEILQIYYQYRGLDNSGRPMLITLKSLNIS
ncbi:MAG: aldehyde ferredoxin oxidoreductase family protein [Candidatus Hodarchaeales archaeon]|jgi:aldehyde:ferredoxin oxidoreductase